MEILPPEKSAESTETITHQHNPEKDLTPDAITLFQKTVYRTYELHGRRFPWRETDNPYHIVVSEVMLQQTQTERVLHKYDQFLQTFPDFTSLASASLESILAVWSGLGYNRRALNLKKTAEIVVEKYYGVLPSRLDLLVELPGIGRNTACAICAFAYCQPVVFIETNIRTVFIYFFFQNENVKDGDILPLVEKTLDRAHPREWYYALMDYGVLLKKKSKPHKRSAHYRKQAPFEGSTRQVRGLILRTLLERQEVCDSELERILGKDPEVVEEILTRLEKEGFIVRENRRVKIKEGS